MHPRTWYLARRRERRAARRAEANRLRLKQLEETTRRAHEAADTWADAINARPSERARLHAYVDGLAEAVR